MKVQDLPPAAAGRHGPPPSRLADPQSEGADQRSIPLASDRATRRDAAERDRPNWPRVFPGL
jgi:hypothetical protein